jgi:hypothetical protein
MSGRRGKSDSVRAFAQLAVISAALAGTSSIARAAKAPGPSASAAAMPAASAAPAPPVSPGPPASPASGASASPRPLGLHASADGHVTFVDRSAAGPGLTAPEAAGFVAGSPLAPNTPYDLFSSAPLVPGVAGVTTLESTVTYTARGFAISLEGGLGYVRGSETNAAYWGGPLLPTLDPHLGSQAFPYAIAFPTHAGGDDGTALRASILAGTLESADGNERLRAGYFDLAQTEPFVFAPPPVTSVNAAVAFAPAESLGNGPPNLDAWTPEPSTLPLQGLDATLRRGDATLELADASLPALPGTPARLLDASLFFDRGEGTTFRAQLTHITTGGLPIFTTVPFGADPAYVASPLGYLPSSYLGGQRQTIAGAGAAFHVSTALAVDGRVDVGRTWYDADGVALPGTSAPGGYYHAGLVKTAGRATASLDYYRMEPRYAPAILPYGVPENQWSAAFAWPGQWLKSNFQSIDNTVLGVNREGYRLRYGVDGGPLEVRLEYTDLRQIEPETRASAEQTGFLDGFYLPQFPDAATLGRQKRYGFWTAWHPALGDFSLDVVDDTLYRGFAANHPEDAVSYEVPQAVLTFARKLSPDVLASASYGRYAIKGAFGEPIDFAERVFGLGLEFSETAKSSVLVNFRRTAFGGISTAPAAGISPDFTSSQVLVEQRVHL